jgi:hypothetical protein
MSSTTVKVPVELRDRIAARARSRHVSQAQVIFMALEALDRREFWTTVRHGYNSLRENPEAWHDYVLERDDWLDAPLIGEQ